MNTTAKDIALELRALIEEELNGKSLSTLQRLVPEIQSRYQQRGDNKIIQNSTEVLTYLSYRMPSTLAAIEGALHILSSRMPTWSPSSVLDIGAGPATMLWATSHRWPHIKKCTMLERERAMIDVAKRLAAQGRFTKTIPLEWIESSLEVSTPLQPHDLVTASYFLGELPEQKRAQLVASLWSKTSQVLLLIEPAKSPQGFLALKAARQQLIQLGGHVVAPCVHSEGCPLTESHWCHFAARLERSSEHRQLKKGFRSYEDEKYSFIAVAKTPHPQPEGIVLFPPQRRKGLLQFEVCTNKGLEKKIFTKSKHEHFSALKDLDWGDTL